MYWLTKFLTEFEAKWLQTYTCLEHICANLSGLCVSFSGEGPWGGVHRWPSYVAGGISGSLDPPPRITSVMKAIYMIARRKVSILDRRFSYANVGTFFLSLSKAEFRLNIRLRSRILAARRWAIVATRRRVLADFGVVGILVPGRAAGPNLWTPIPGSLEAAAPGSEKGPKSQGVAKCAPAWLWW